MTRYITILRLSERRPCDYCGRWIETYEYCHRVDDYLYFHGGCRWEYEASVE